MSKVLSNRAAAWQLSPQIVERVRAVAEQLGYVPNTVARHLRAQRTGQIGLMLGMLNIDGPTALTFNGALLLGLSTSAKECGLPAIVLNPRDDV